MPGTAHADFLFYYIISGFCPKPLGNGYIITGCPSNQQDADTEHGEMREEDHDHDHVDENRDMLMDSTSMEMDDDDMMD